MQLHCLDLRLGLIHPNLSNIYETAYNTSKKIKLVFVVEQESVGHCAVRFKIRLVLL